MDTKTMIEAAKVANSAMAAVVQVLTPEMLQSLAAAEEFRAKFANVRFNPRISK